MNNILDITKIVGGIIFFIIGLGVVCRSIVRLFMWGYKGRRRV